MLEFFRGAGFLLFMGGLILAEVPWVSTGVRMLGVYMVPVGAVMWAWCYLLHAMQRGRWIWPAYIVLSAAVLVSWLQAEGFPWGGFSRSEFFGKLALFGPFVLAGWWLLGGVLSRMHAIQRRSLRAEQARHPPAQKPPARAAVLGEMFQLARRVGEKPQDLRPAPSESEISAMEAALGARFHNDLRRYLRELSQLQVGSLTLATITDPAAPHYLPRLVERARGQGLPALLLPFCHADGDWFCIAESGEVEFWSSREGAHDRWPSLAEWMREVWLREATGPDLPRAPKMGTGVSALGAERIPFSLD